MIRIAVLGDIGSGKSHIAKQFGYPVLMLMPKLLNYIEKAENVMTSLKKHFLII